MSEDIPLNFELLPSELTQKIRYLLNILYLVSSVKPSVECSNWLNFFHEIDLAESVEELQLHYFKYLSLNIEKNN
jgi:hypothetical protein